MLQKGKEKAMEIMMGRSRHEATKTVGGKKLPVVTFCYVLVRKANLFYLRNGLPLHKRPMLNLPPSALEPTKLSRRGVPHDFY
jgi:hypothetical protein